MKLFHKIAFTLCEIICGFKSNIPICCIIFYITIWRCVCNIDNKNKNHFIKNKYHQIVNNHYNTNYVCCPVCLIRNNFRIIKQCNHIQCKECNPLYRVIDVINDEKNNQR